MVWALLVVNASHSVLLGATRCYYLALLLGTTTRRYYVLLSATQHYSAPLGATRYFSVLLTAWVVRDALLIGPLGEEQKMTIGFVTNSRRNKLKILL